MNSHALAVLEFPVVLAHVATFASSEAGAEHVRALQPSTSLEYLGREHQRVAAMRTLVHADNPWRPEPVPAVASALARLRIEGAACSAEELGRCRILLASGRRTRDALGGDRASTIALAVLRPFAERMVVAPRDEAEIERAIADDDTVRDDASPALRKIRRELRGAQGELVRLLERMMSGLEPNQRVTDMSVTLRNGRYVIPIRREARVAIGGIVHDSSATGSTLFVEPPAALEYGNRMRELEADEWREIDRILLELTDRIRPLREQMRDSLDALTELDSLYARAQFAIQFKCSPVELGAPVSGFSIHDGRHPLLLAQHIDVIPFDLAMEGAERTLLVSGPNTGGKTVLMKALGLISAMTQSGVPAPVGAESQLPIYDDFFADIGDEQSIEASLSTFSAHLKNLREILVGATSASLVLIDELGSGTDPLEGAALGGAILESLTARGATTVASTHLGALKELSTQVSGVVNASLQFDDAALAPTYRLIKGIPGRSYGLRIARRLGLPADVLERAEARIPLVERNVTALLAELEARQTVLTDRERESEATSIEARERLDSVTARERNVLEREREVEKQQRKDARRYLLEARSEVERVIRELRTDAETATDDASRAARQAVEQLIGSQGQALDRLEGRGREVASLPVDSTAPRAGDAVHVATLGGKIGRLTELRDDLGVVTVGAIRLTVPLNTLRRAAAPAPTPVPVYGDVPDVHAPSEIDLRGLRVDEVDSVLLSAVDSASRADLKSLRIIHGKGTGVLRERVGEMLAKDTRIRTYRLGAWNEGGVGVTVAELS